MLSRLDPVTGVSQAHKGIDYGKDGSQDIKAAAAGTVTRAEVIGGYGNVVTIAHVINGKKYETLYAHLKSYSVKVGQVVKKAELIGIKGSTGNSTGIHLHFEIHDPAYAPGQPNAIDPFPLVEDPEVVDLQKLLNNAGYKLVEDGVLGSATTEAVKDFQKKNKLVVDGIAGEKTLAALKAVKVIEKVLKLGDRGAEVKILQNALNKIGYKLVADGVFGLLTESAVKDFQKAHGLVVDGIYGPKSSSALDKVLNK
jgi:murein DD-endopeptidase MepM/ murein hydrolase activator NlpD